MIIEISRGLFDEVIANDAKSKYSHDFKDYASYYLMLPANEQEMDLKDCCKEVLPMKKLIERI